MSESSKNHGALLFISKEKLYNIFFDKSETINSLLSIDTKLSKDFLINSKDEKIFNFLIKYFKRSGKLRDFKAILRHKNICKGLIFKSKINQYQNMTKIYLTKFFLICIFNSSELLPIFGYKNENIIIKLFHLLRVYYLHNLLDNENILSIIRLKLYPCFYGENYNINELRNQIINKNIIDITPLETIIKFLLSFTEENMSEKQIINFNEMINEFCKLFTNLFLENYNNLIQLSNYYIFYRLLELSKISLETINTILPIFKKVFKFNFKLDFSFDDLSEQFLIKKGEDIEKKNNNIIAKNKFLDELFGCEKTRQAEYLIKNGFVFNDNINNGLVYYANVSFSFPSQSYSMVISFKLIKSETDKHNKSKKYCVFSVSEADNFEYTRYVIFIEDKKLKILFGDKHQEVLFDSIKYNQPYILWIFSEGINKKNETIFYLNKEKITKKINYNFPETISSINIGFQNLKKQNNFEGIIGTFILFNKCFISNNPNNKKGSEIFEKIFLELKFNYEDLIYINYHTEYSLLEKETLDILDKLNSDNISRYITAIISSKSVVSNDFCCSNKKRKVYKANYFCYRSEEKEQATIRFKSDKICPIIDNYNFSGQNCFITYPIHLKNSFDDFINNNGIKFLEMELYYFIGVIEYCNLNESYLKNFNERFCEYIQTIFKLFLICINELKPIQEKENEENIEQFFYTFNNLMELKLKSDFKIDYKFLMSISGFMDIIMKKINFCNFIFNSENYDSTDDKTVHLLFESIYIDFEKNYNEFFSVNNFEKILNFSKIYYSKEMKSSKKSYSVLIQNILFKAIKENKTEILSLYLNKIKNLQEQKTDEQNYIIEEDNDELELKNDKKKLSMMSTSSKLPLKLKYLSETEKEKEKEELKKKEKKELEDIILMYKLLKNLYLCLDIDKKHTALEKFSELNLDIEEKELLKFFNNIFSYFNEKFGIYEKNIYKSKAYEEDEETDFNINEINYFNNEPETKEEKEAYKKKCRYAEFIKSICIRFIDEMSLDNIKNFKHDNSRLSLSKPNIGLNNSKYSNRNTTNSTFYKSGSSFNLYHPSRNTVKNELYLNANKNSADKVNNNSPEINKTKYFEFFSEFTISPYTFNSFFLIIMRNWNSRDKLKFIKIIKNLDDKKSDEQKLIIYKIKNIKDVLDLIPIITSIIQRLGDEEYDTIFMNKVDLLKLAYDKFIKFIFDMLEHTEQSLNSPEDLGHAKPITNNLLCKNDYITNFFLIIFDSLKTQKEKASDVSISNGEYEEQNYSDKENKEKLKEMEKQIEDDMKKIIDKTIYEYVDIFYFKLFFSMYRKDYNRNDTYDLILRIMEYIILKFDEYEEIHPFILKKENVEDKNYIKVGLNNKNLLLLIYQMTFFKPRKSYLIESEIFEKNIVLYLTTFLQKKKLVYLKIFFPIEEKENTENKTCQKKLIIEMLFEICLNLYQSYKEKDNPQFSIFETLINELLEGGRDDSMKKSKKKNEGKIAKTICYDIDEWNLRKKYNEFSKNFFTYLKDIDPSEQGISVTILFLIKITIYIYLLEKNEKKSNLIDFFIEMDELLCQNAKKLQQNYANYKPLLSSSVNSTPLYEEFTSFILKEYTITSVYDKNLLISKIKCSSKAYRQYTNVDYSKEGKARLVSISSNINLLGSDKKKTFYSNSPNFDECSEGKSTKEEYAESSKTNFYKNNAFSNSTNELLSFNKEKDKKFMSIGFLSSKKEKNKKIIYKIIPKFSKYFLRTKFSIYFIKLLTYDEDFIKVKKIYNYLYHNEISDINKYSINYPSRLKNRLGNIYVKHFLKKDFNFTTSNYFQYSHKCIHKRNFIPSTKTLFPSKKILEKYDFANKDIINILKKKEGKIITRSCELITYDGAIFGNIFILDNCILFFSDIHNDKRKIKDSLEYACCSMEFDFLEKDTMKIIEFDGIKNVIPRKFLYSWMSLEIFMKYGKTYLFNFFQESTNEFVLDTLKGKNVKVIKNVKEYFDKKDYSKKWRDGKKTTYDYLLILNKFSSRTYNDSNQYPIMPWTFMEDKRLRDFDIPMSIQKEETKERFLKMPNDSEEKQNRWHSNHYSTSAYICYYLMRINPFTESMIKFQSNAFDVPERQFCDIKQTLLLCENNNNNREPIPELYTIPEAYINLNCNDFGEQILNKTGRIHNVKFSPYADNAFEFIYNFKDRLNNDEETNTNINLWFDFIFGINQFNKDNMYGEGLRNFNKYCYGQNINIKKIKDGLKKKHKTDSEIYDEIKSVMGMVISFGQCPFQILTNPHPKRIYTKGVHNIVMNTADKKKLNKEEQELAQAKEKKDEKDEIDFFISYDTDESMVEKKYDDNSRKNNIIYFTKSIFKKNLYCILNNKDIEVYQKSSWSKDYKFVKNINVSKNYLLFKKNVNGYPILKPEFLFCELKEEHFIFCRYLDNSIKLLTPNMETQFLLDSFITCVIRINENEFITGDNKGKLCHWKINTEILNIKLKLIKKVKSNKNNITSMIYNKKLNIVISTDNNSIVIRNFYDFEFLTYIDISDIKSEETIVDVKCSNYDFVYVLIHKGGNIQELRGYSLNGICFGKYEDKITNFELTKEGKILVGFAEKGMIGVLNPITFKNIHFRFVEGKDTKFYMYHFYFEEPNILYIGFKDNEGAKIKIIQLNNDEIKTFI